jgi:hypothetical protein
MLDPVPRHRHHPFRMNILRGWPARRLHPTGYSACRGTPPAAERVVARMAEFVGKRRIEEFVPRHAMADLVQPGPPLAGAFVILP